MERDSELEKIRKKKLEELKAKMQEKKPKELIIEINDSDFQEVVIEKSREIPVVVDFWAPWCQPCLMLSPILEKLVSEYEGKFILGKVNLDQNKIIAQKYGIMSIPDVRIFKNGNVVDEFLGARPENMVREWLEKNL